MTKIIFDVPDLTLGKVDFFNDKGELEHLGLIPSKVKELKTMIESNENLSKYTKQILFITIIEIISSMNKMGFNKWIPDKLKTVFVPIFFIGLVSNKQLIKLLMEK